MSRYLLDTRIAQDFINLRHASGSGSMTLVIKGPGSAFVRPYWVSYGRVWKGASLEIEIFIECTHSFAVGGVALYQ